MADCTIEYKGKEFKTEKSLNDKLVEDMEGPSSNGGPKTSGKMIRSALLESSKKYSDIRREHAKAKDDDTISRYTGVMNILKSRHGMKYNTKDDTVGDFATTIGNEYHHVTEEVIKNLRNKKLKDTPFKGIKFKTDHHEQWAKRVVELYNTVWNPNGDNQVLTEITVGSEENMVTGDIDVITITPEGIAKIYDIKVLLSKNFKPNPKYEGQMNFYKRMLAEGNESHKVPKVHVESMHLVPIHIESETTEDSQGNKVKRITDQNIDSPILDVEKDKINFPNNDIAKADVESFFKKNSETAEAFNIMKKKHNVNFSAFNEALFGLDITDPQSYLSDISRTIEQDSEGNYFYKLNGKTKYFKHKSAHRTDQFGHERRIYEIRKEIDPDAENGDITDEFIRLLTHDDPKTTLLYGPTLDKAIQLKNKLYPYQDKTKIHAVRADSLPGMEQVGSDILIVYKGWDEETKSATSYDIISVTEAIGEEDPINHNNKNNRSTLAGKHLTDIDVKIQKQAIGMHHMDPFKRNKRNERAIRMGLVSMVLNQTSNLKLNKIIASSLGENKLDSKALSLPRILDNIKLLSQLKINQKPVIEDGLFDNNLKNLLSNQELFDVKNYEVNEVLNYLDYLMASYNAKSHFHRTRLKKEISSIVKAKTDKQLVEVLFEGNRVDLDNTIAEIQEDAEYRRAVLDIFIARQKDLAADETSQEYKFVNNAIVQLNGMYNDLHSAQDISIRQGWDAGTGMTGIEIIDKFQDLVKSSMRQMSIDYLEEYYPNKIDKFKEFYKANSKMNALDKLIGQEARLFSELLEYKEFELEDNPGKKVKRRTGRFWAEGSKEWINLDDSQKKFIKWYKGQIKSALVESLDDNTKKQFDKLWGDDWIPFLNSGISNQLSKLIYRKHGPTLELKDALKSTKARLSKMYKSHDDYIDIQSDNQTTLINLFGTQLSKVPVENNIYGDPNRLERLGIRQRKDGTYVAIRHFDDVQETNLERILDLAVMNKYRQKYMKDLVPLKLAIKSRISVEEATRGDTKFTNLTKHFDVWADRIIQQKRAAMKNEKAEKGFRIVHRVSSAIALSWNYASQIKNFLAGFGHTFMNASAESFAQGNTKMLKAYIKAYKDSFKSLNRGHRGIDQKINSIMTQFAMGDMDAESLTQGFVFKAGGRNVGMLGHIGNNIQDYFHRSHMTAAQMAYDGTLDSYVQEEVDGKIVWRYKEELDPRFKGKHGDLLKQKIKEEMVKDRTIKSIDDRMPRPYTHKELTAMKRKQNQTLEINNIEDSNLSKAYAITGLLKQMKGWLTGKMDRWFQKGILSDSEGKFVVKTITDKDGNKTEEVVWEGAYIEGMFRSMGALFSDSYSLLAAGDIKQFNKMWNSLNYKQKENFHRFWLELGFVGMFSYMVSELFDDDEKDTVAYSVLIRAIEEVNLLSQLLGAKDFIENPWTSLNIFRLSAKRLISEDADERWQSLATISGFGKVPLLANKLHEDFN